MGKKITIVGFIGLFIGFFILIIGMPLHNPPHGIWWIWSMCNFSCNCNNWSYVRLGG